MGIHKFHKWLQQEYPKAHKEVKIHTNNKYDYIYIDMNHILHNCIRKTTTEQEFMNKMFVSLNLILNNFIAMKKVIIATDGPAPYSKIIIQRQRRVKYLEQIGQTGEMNINYNKLNPIYITPGTEFMKRIDENIRTYVNELKQNYYYHNLDIILSLTDEPDEGEIKIFRLMKYFNHNVNSTHLVIGNDADLVLLAMAQHPIKDIDLLVKNKDKYEMISVKNIIDSHYKSYSKYCKYNQEIYDETLSDDMYELEKDLQELNKKELECDLEKNIRYDFIMLSLLMGNDYLPKVSWLNFKSIWNTYTKTFRKYNTGLNNQENNVHSLINNGLFNNIFLKRFIIDIALLTKAKTKKFTITGYDPIKVINYLEGLLWCLNMYISGKCLKYDYVYESGCSLSAMDLMIFFICNPNYNVELKFSYTPALSTKYYTLYIMPMQAKKLIPENCHHFMENELKYIYDDETCATCRNYRAEPNENININEHIKNEHHNKGKGFTMNDIKKNTECLENI